ncbi:MAG: TraR/DksA family transcriptional regulator [Akkermansiaceae bacterium]
MAAKKKTTGKKQESSAKKTAKKVAVKAKTSAVKKTAQKKAVKAPARALQVKPAAQSAVELKGFAKIQYQKLLDLRDSMLDLMHGVTHDTIKSEGESAGGGMHLGDASSDSYDRDFALNLLAMEQDSLSEIEQAITRAEAGLYGICEMSGLQIPKERLEAIPFARYTVQCQEVWEKTNGNKRQHNRDQFGFVKGAMR